MLISTELQILIMALRIIEKKYNDVAWPLVHIIHWDNCLESVV